MSDLRRAIAVSVESGSNATGQIRRAIENLNILKLSFSQYISVMYDAYGCSATIQLSRIGQAAAEKYNMVISNLEEAKNKTSALEKNTYLEGRSFDFIYFSDAAVCGVQAIAGIAAAIGGKIRIARESIAGCSQKLDTLLADMEEELGMLSQTQNVISGMSFMVTVEEENACRTYMYSGSQDMSFVSGAEQQFIRTAASKKSQAYDLVNTACQQLQFLTEKIRQMKENINSSIINFERCNDNFRITYQLFQIGNTVYSANPYEDASMRISQLQELNQSYGEIYSGTSNKDVDDAIKKVQAEVEINLNVYADSQDRSYYCGPSSAYMVLRYKDMDLSEERIAHEMKTDAKRTSSPSGIADELNKYLGPGTYDFSSTVNLSDEEFLNLLIKSLNNDCPVVAQIMPVKSDGSNMIEKFGYDTKGVGHFIVITGLGIDNMGNYYVTVNDPYSSEWSDNNHQGQVIDLSLSDFRQSLANHWCGMGYIVAGTGN